MEEIKEEITNKVLETKIDGLSKLTDERFLNLKETLVRIESYSASFATKKELSDVEKEVDDITKKVDKLRQTVAWGMGGLSVITFFLPFALHYLLGW